MLSYAGRARLRTRLESAEFWPSVMTELRNRGVEDILITFINGLRAPWEAITAAFPEAVRSVRLLHPRHAVYQQNGPRFRLDES
jgi:transposase-like protein